ncbi:amino acid adenylation domain-containing protein, partial [Kitasatospora sp. NPDC059462]|uniref:amino acid adenylation domain-containing protein n=2 Tax=unclassified Kitasatospora TaxID=2633591 RepID=UPI0036929464
MSIDSNPVSDMELARLREEVLRRRLAGTASGRRTEIPLVDRGRPMPLSFGQQQMWFLHRLDPQSAEYHVPLAVRLRGALDTEALRAAWEQVVARHEILRTRYLLVGEEPRQVVDAPAAPQWTVTDLTEVPADERDRRARELAEADFAAPFDLEQRWPVRASLLKLHEDEHLLVVTFHHIACDAWSVRLLTGELSALYRAGTGGEPARLAPLPVQYADFAAWQRDRLTGPHLEKELSYWRERLAGAQPLELPTDRRRPAVRGWAGRTVRRTIPAELAARARSLGTRHGTTLFTTLLTGWQLLLSRYAGTTDIPVGVTISGRNHPELQQIVGYGINTLVARGQWQGDPSFARLVDDGRDTLLGAFDHQTVPFARLVDELQPERDMSRTPLFQVDFVLQEDRTGAFDLPGLTVEALDGDRIAKFDLTLELQEAADGSLDARFTYAEALFDHATVERLAGHYETLLRAVTEHPELPVGALNLLPAAEQEQILTAFNATDAGFPHTSTLADLVEEQAARTPDAPAVSFDGLTLDHTAFNARANQVAHRLLELGAGPETVVAVCAERSLDLAVAIHGVVKAGAAYLPLDPEHPDARLDFMLADSAAPILLTTRDQLGRRHPDDTVRVLTLDDPAEWAGQSTDNPERTAGPDNAAYVIYTSGSTGQPKGVVTTHRAIVNRLHWMQNAYGLTAADTVLQKTPAGFDVSVWEFFWPLIAGARLEIALPGGHRDPAYLRELIDRAGVTVAHFVPSMLSLFLAEAGTDGGTDAGNTAGNAAGAGRLCPSLRLVLCSGEALPAQVATRALAALPAQLHNLYGPTEAAVDVTAWHCTPEELAGLARVPIGGPIDNIRLLVLDDRLRPAPIGVPGQLHICGVGVARGYLGRPALTADRFLPDPFGDPGDRMYATGDLARWRPDGTLDFLGRIDTQVKLRGLRIEPGEIETALREQPRVRDAAVVVREDDDRDQHLVAYVVGDADPERLRAAIRERLPEYMVPTALVRLDALPLSANGKLDHRALPAPERSALATDAHIAPRTPVEERIAAVWAEVLGLPVEQVGVEDGFFDLGGDSIRAVRLSAALREAGHDLTIRQIFEHRTVAALAVAAAAGTPVAAVEPVAPFALIGDEDRAALPADVVDAYPLSQIQTGMIVEMLADDGRNTYHNVNSFRIPDDRPFSSAALTGALAVVAGRHDVLRTSVHLAGYAQPLQLVHAEVEIPLTVHDVRELTAEQRRDHAAELLRRERAAAFDPARAPLLRLNVHVESDRAWRLTFTQCHVITDGWSVTSLLMELLEAYRCLRDEVPLPFAQPPAVRYADFVAAELESLDNEDDRAYWQHITDTHMPVVLPTGWGAEGPREHHRFQVPYGDLESGLRGLAAAARTSLKSVLLAAHVKVLGMLTPEPAFHTGLVAHGRLEATGGDRVLGMHLNTVPFPADRSARTWRELVEQVFDQETAIWGHRRYPLPAIQRNTGGSERLLDVMFDYQDFHQVDTDSVDLEATLGDGFTEFGLHVNASGGNITLTCPSDVFSGANGERLAGMYRRVLEAMAADPTGDARATYLPETEALRLLEEWNRAVTIPGEECVHRAFEHQAAATPDALALTFEDTHLTYRELNERANRIAHHLIEQGAAPETLVAVCLERGIDLIPTLLGVLKSGAGYLPLDPSNPVERLGYILGDARASVVVTQQRHTDLVSTIHQGQMVVLDSDVDAAVIDARPATDPTVDVRADNLIYVIYTSGSTGTPKGVTLTHANVWRLLASVREQFAFGADDVWTLFHSYAFDVSVWEMWGALLHGGRLVVAPFEVLRSPHDFLDLMVTQRATILCQTPTAFRSLTTLAADGDPRIDELALRAVVFAGEKLEIGDLAPWTDRLGSEMPALVNMYGITETTVHSTYHQVTAADLASPHRNPIGSPLADLGIHLLDERGHLVPVGIPGEIHVAGPGVARGYLNRPDLTAERFVPDPYGPASSRMYRSGDLARRLADGTLEFLGRIDTQVKIRGYRIELGEIQA